MTVTIEQQKNRTLILSQVARKPAGVASISTNAPSLRSQDNHLGY